MAYYFRRDEIAVIMMYSGSFLIKKTNPIVNERFPGINNQCGKNLTFP